MHVLTPEETLKSSKISPIDSCPAKIITADVEACSKYYPGNF